MTLESKHWIVDFRNDWKQLFGKWNWYTFTVIQLDFEKENMAHGYEFNFVLLGLGVYIRYNTDKSFEQFEEWDKEVEEAVQNKDLIEEYSETWTALSEYDKK